MSNQDYSLLSSNLQMASACRFTVLLLFYALLYINHWSIIAVGFLSFLKALSLTLNDLSAVYYWNLCLPHF
jgi:Cholesterol-capturing domain